VPDVSVVVPTRDRRALLLRTLASARIQRGVDLEIIVVDDGSTDGSATAVRDLGDPRIEVISHTRSRGVSAARNAGLDRATAAWVAFLDDDDLWAPDKLLSQLAVAADGNGVGWVCAGAVTIDPALEVVSGQLPPTPELLRHLPAYNVIPGGGSGTVARTDLLRAVGGFDANLSNMADWDLWIRLSRAARLGVVDRPLTAYLRHPTSLSHDLTSIRQEFEHTRAKHAGERRARQLAPSSRTIEWFVHRQVQQGNRLAAARAYVDLWRRYDSRKSLRWAGVALVAPGLLRRRRDRTSRARLPQWWVEEAERWLAAVRAQVAVPAPADGVSVPGANRPQAGVG
jgi:glycosyltransferase involved in cell wall biosynthesis